jgi:pimeloyl-ACP methyl ester carboxylesterase
MSTFVLVHGAWQTASTWDLVTPLLREAGHVVTIPLLSGLENDSRVLSAEINLSTHIQDVVGALTRDDLSDVILVGHSYGGMVITGVADRIPDRLDRLVYVDAFVPADGESALDLLPPPVAQMFRQSARSSEAGWLLPAGESQLDLWGLKPGAPRDFVRARLSDFSIRCFEEHVTLKMDAGSRLGRTYIACVAEGYPARAVFQPFADRARRDGWAYHELPTGHDCHVEMPDAFVSKLLGMAAAA